MNLDQTGSQEEGKSYTNSNMKSYRDLALTLKNKDARRAKMNIDDILSVELSEFTRMASPDDTGANNNNFSSAYNKV